MSRWKLKATVQKTISYLPHSHGINHLFQKYVTKGVALTDDYFYDRLNHASDHIRAFTRHHDLSSLRYSLEIGTGWYPIVPMALFLCGAEDIYSVDIASLSDKEKLKQTIQRFIEAKKFGTLQTFIPYREDKMRFLESIIEHYDQLTYEKILHLFNFHFVAAEHVRMMLPTHKIHLIHSNNTFEHIHPDDFPQLLDNFNIWIHPTEGVMSHFIDMSDHFAHFDSNISIYNFLKYSDREWAIIDNSIQPQNRLRFIDYIRLFRSHHIPISRTDIEIGNIEELGRISLNSKYKDYSLEDLAVSHGRIESIMS